MLVTIQLATWQIVAAIITAVGGAIVVPVLTYWAAAKKVRAEEKKIDVEDRKDTVAVILGMQKEIEKAVEERMADRLKSLEERADSAEKQLSAAQRQGRAATKRAEDAEKKVQALSERLRVMEEDQKRLLELVKDTQEGFAIILPAKSHEPEESVRYAYINPIGALMNAGPPQEAYYGQLVSRMVPNLFPHAYPKLVEARETQEPWEGVFSAPGPDGSPQDWTVQYRPLFDDMGEFICWACVFHLIRRARAPLPIEGEVVA